jgi:hypothetical protein
MTTKEKIRNSVTLTVSIDRPYESVFDYLSDPKNDPAWAVNFIKAVKTAGGKTVAVTPMGEIPLEVRSDRRTGVIDKVFGGRVVVPTRVVKNGGGADYVFTLHQPDDMPDEAWEGHGVPGLREELDTLKRILEGRK